jgi:hypothetical protein
MVLNVFGCSYAMMLVTLTCIVIEHVLILHPAATCKKYLAMLLCNFVLEFAHIRLFTATVFHLFLFRQAKHAAFEAVFRFLYIVKLSF